MRIGSLVFVNRSTMQSMEKLASGLRINKAGDDASGFGGQ